MRRTHRGRAAAILAIGPALLLLGACGGGSSPSTPATAPAGPPAATARYRVTFEGLWSPSTHPDSFPARPHFTGLIGSVHGDGVRFWTAGGLATTGIKDMAERGRKSPLDAEVEAAIAAGTAGAVLSGDGIGTSPGATSLELEASTAFPQVTLVSMIGPSPDWFVGVSGLPLLGESGWLDQVTVDLVPWDAGTDDGASYQSPDAASVPHRPVTRLERPPVLVSGTVPPFARFVFTRL